MKPQCATSLPSNALERIAQAVRELGWEMAYYTDDTGEKVIAMVIGELEEVEMLTGDDETAEFDDEDESGEVGH